ncbi:hypothetical protein K470DRAFT_281587 [Piedraia hortae CBS 480.64]|uniref:Uncharacterized protein n=1 Tax=Piedraia hortae CBS 480.64 TaxID=1314780 RepID=A0A6A7C1G3_9PEZI|nr:hypothetical protein K470DRAFT_281587 [Piedraia hortae CBS 480.64]
MSTPGPLDLVDPADDVSTIDSLPSPTTTFSSSGSESDADAEWTESIRQLELLLTMVLVPLVGKYYGRKVAYWGWAKFMEWKFPVTVEIANPKSFKAVGAVEAAASL